MATPAVMQLIQDEDDIKISSIIEDEKGEDVSIELKEQIDLFSKHDLFASILLHSEEENVIIGFLELKTNGFHDPLFQPPRTI